MVAVCFVPMAFDTTPVVQQLGLLLVLSALAHAFIVRPTLVPVLMLWWDEAVWWPAHLALPAEADYVGSGIPPGKIARPLTATPAPVSALFADKVPRHGDASTPPLPTRRPIMTGPFPGGPPPLKEM